MLRVATNAVSRPIYDLSLFVLKDICAMVDYIPEDQSFIPWNRYAPEILAELAAKYKFKSGK